MNTVITNTVSASDKKAQYDERAKHLLSQKIILAHILVNTIDEFKGMKNGISQIIVNIEIQKDEQSNILCQPDDFITEAKGFYEF